MIQGHVEASQFSAIYPQKSIPSVSAVGYNGLLLWQHEGFINVESFADNIEKTWASMHIQDTTAALLSVALASKGPEPSSSRSSDVTLNEEGEPSSLHNPLSLADNHALNVDTGPSNDPKALVEQQGKDSSEDDNSLQLDNANVAKVYTEDNENKENETTNILHSVTQNMTNFEDQCYENNPRSSPESVAAIYLSNPGSSQIDATDVHKETGFVLNEIMESKNTMKSTTIHLSIRMPSGSSLQEKFDASDRLSSVKNYVDDNDESSLGSYDLAIPYPRKVFGDEDVSKTLSELQFADRQALIVIPRRQLPSKAIQTATNQVTNDNAMGFFGHLKRALSYINPFSYLGGNGGSSSYETVPEDDLWEHGSNPSIPSSSSRGETQTPRTQHSSNPQNYNAGSSGRTSRPFGSNIHTLRHDEDDFRSSDRNTFWNGNSTQFGGNDK